MPGSPIVFSVTSGKGGVGKTNMSVNIACCLARAGKRVVLMDADLGLANVDVVLGLAPEKNIFHLFTEELPLKNILYHTPYGFPILPAASGVSDMLTLDTGQKLALLDTMDVLEDAIDYLIVDTGAGINDTVLYFNLAVQERILVITPEPTSLTDAYATIKVLNNHHDVNRFRVLVNMAPDAKGARDVFATLYKACDHFLSGVSLDYLGYVPTDPAVRKAVVAQKPFCVTAPDSGAAASIRQVAGKIANWKPDAKLDGNIKFFWKKLLFQEQSVA